MTVTLLFPVVVLILLELGLRAGGYGSDYPLFISYPDRPDYLVPNQEVAKRYFGNGPFVPTPQMDFFRKSKNARAFRIFFQGESSAIGFPYVHGGAPSRMLEQRIQATFPERDIEMINTALTAVNSHTLLDFADEIIAQDPDAVMIYTGHNEYYGAFGAGSAGRLMRSRGSVRAYLAVRQLRLGQLALNLVTRTKSAATQSSEGAPRTVMQLMAGDQRIPLGSKRYEAGLDQFRRNLGELLSRYRARRIPVFIATIASNERDQHPFITGLRSGTDSAAWWALHDSATAASRRQDTAAAERFLNRAIGLDGSGAIAFYSLAKIQDARQLSARAAVSYRHAKELDELRFRAPEAINTIIREQAHLHGANIVETQKVLQQAARDGVIGSDLMLEHLHPNIDGYFLVADAFFEAIRSTQLIGDWSSAPSAAEARSTVPVTALDSLIGFFHADRLTSGWPFRPKGGERAPLVDTIRPATAVESLAQRVVLGHVSWPEAMDRLRVAYQQAGELDKAVRVSLAMAQEYRYSARPYVEAAQIEVGRRRYDAALKYILLATSREETPMTVQLAGLLLLRQSEHERAIRYLERSVQLAPGDRRTVVALRTARAIPDLEQARAHTPRDTTVLYTIAGAYALTQQYEKAREALTSLRAVAPNHAGAKQLIARIPPQ
ncbi:MAG TPA: tetratricopeptide repeat protein [Gemmatimonadaceae bacterium]|nr:tetratricopeptide repeat protein [Gemmatimonadaceae bacterium]